MKRRLRHVYVLWFLLLAACTSSLSPNPRAVPAEPNVVLVTLDGLRWQELFRGLDNRLVNHEDYSSQREELIRRFWHDDAETRARKLFPFLYEVLMEQGSVIGNRDRNSCAQVANPWYFSYPGYSEILTGVVNDAIDSNRKIPNPERTIHELLESHEEFEGGTAAFASWDVFPFIFNTARSGLYVNAFAPLAEPIGDTEQIINQLHQDIPPPWPTVRNDAFTHHFALSYLKREQPRLLFISYGETDDFAHEGKYDEYIFAAHRTDRLIAQVWQTLQSIPQYRNNTVLLVSVDHGRGEEPIETWLHHASKRSLDGYMSSLAQYEEGIVGSEATWIAAMGPGVRQDGMITTGDECVTSSQIAATVLALLGYDYRRLNAEMAAPIQVLLQ